jgi:pimeloyl-ACP methyl ester carboxylesterase
MFSRSLATQRITLGRDCIEYVRAGQGTPSIVLVNGSDGSLQAWRKIFPALASVSTTLACNLAGIGSSSPARLPQTAAHMVVATLNALLVSLDVPQPYVLVGHAFGGLIVNLFARLHAAETAAVVFVEATTPEDIQAFDDAAACNPGARRLLKIIRPRCPRSELSEAQSFVREIAAAPAFPSVPLRVISGSDQGFGWAKTLERRALRAYHQERLTRLSPQGLQIVAPGNCRRLQLTHASLVVHVIQEIVGTLADRA